MRLTERLYRFMAGRNGNDSLGNALIVLYLALFILNIFIGSPIISILILVIMGYEIFRMLSRNIYARQKENRAWLKVWGKFKGFFKMIRNRFRDRKTHVYRKCPACKNNLRLPKKKGKHTVNCPCCHKRFEVKI